MSEPLCDRLQHIRSSLPESVRLVAVSKYFPAEAAREAYALGLRDFGESRVQEALDKQTLLQDCPDIVWHLIGHLQTNKAKKALEIFDWIHSVDSLKLAQRLDRLSKSLDSTPQLCLQVKMLPDPDKYGWTVPELLADLPALAQCRSLRIRGLMSILPLGLTETEAIAAFERLRDLAVEIQQRNLPGMKMQELSMGMSNDYALAVRAGATMVRLGRCLFGDRPTPKP